MVASFLRRLLRGQAPGLPDSDKIDYVEFDRAQYSALCDTTTCSVCRELDGPEVPVTDARYRRYYPPHRECASPQGCRCVWVLISRHEKKAVR